jgi:DnaA family protein
MKQLPLGVRLRTAAVFDSFAVGPNVEVFAALRGADTAPVWVWGGHATGKTHLLQAVCAAAGESAGYFPLASALGLPPAALAGFEACRVLCLDDVDAVAGDIAWEEALFRLFNAAEELPTRMIFAAQAAPRRLPWILEDLASRAASCVVYQLRALDDVGVAVALRLRAAQHGLELPPETVDYLLRRLPRDVTSLFDILDHLDEASLIAQRRLTIPFIRDALEKLAGTAPARKTSQTPPTG